MFDVVALGELLIDFAPQGTNEAGYPILSANPGGAPGNFLAALSRYGCSAAMIGKVGDDLFGRLLTDTVRKAGIDTKGVVADPDQFTTLAFVTLDPGGNRDFSFARKPGADTCLRPEEIDESMFKGSRVFHFGTLSLTGEPAASATRRALELARKHDLLISVDPNLRLPLWPDRASAAKAIEWSLQQADVVKISDEEIRFLWDLSPEEGGRRLLDEYGVRLAYITLGPKGCYALNRNGAVYVSSPSGIQAVDTTGAGDIFGGSAMSRLLRSGEAPEELIPDDLEKIVRFACTAASLSTRKHGGISSIPEEEEVLRML